MIGLLALAGRGSLTNPNPRLALHHTPSFQRGTPSSGRKPTQGTVSSESAQDDTSQRTPPSNPEEGLKHHYLLLNNNTLVITRKLEMLSIFTGFEQSNLYTIGTT
ncbi:hypothetical protein F4604DRAFT_1814438 [Suillus subluteus]|nr:hypothetical protein F4604DRAFT_1814438 [Suillus subluteus]